MKKLNPEHRALFLLSTIVLFILLVPLLEANQLGEFFLVISMFFTLIAATIEVGGHRGMFWGIAGLAVISMLLIVWDYVVRTRASLIANHLALAVFFGIVVALLFSYLGRPGETASGRLYVSVSLYFLLGIFWYTVCTFLNAVQPGSYAEGASILSARVAPSNLLYFSLATLTTLGYGDIVAVRPVARILSALEASTGVLYVAITVARLVAVPHASVKREQ